MRGGGKFVSQNRRECESVRRAQKTGDGIAGLETIENGRKSISPAYAADGRDLTAARAPIQYTAARSTCAC